MKFVEFPHEDTFDYEKERTCVNCAHVFTGRYCNRCGERVVVPEERSIPSLFRETFSKIPILDNKLTRTLRLMLTKTGFVSRRYIEGQRIPFVHPLAIFLLINFLYFLFPGMQTFNSPLRTQMHFLMHSDIATEMVGERVRADKTTLEQFNVRYDQHASSVAKIMLVGFALILAVPFWIGHYSSGLYFRDHLIVSLEYGTVALLLNSLLVPWTVYFVAWLISGVSRTAVFESPYLIALTALISLALFYFIERRVYDHARKQAILFSLIMMAGLLIAVNLYLGLVFFVSMWTL